MQAASYASRPRQCSTFVWFREIVLATRNVHARPDGALRCSIAAAALPLPAPNTPLDVHIHSQASPLQPRAISTDDDITVSCLTTRSIYNLATLFSCHHSPTPHHGTTAGQLLGRHEPRVAGPRDAAVGDTCRDPAARCNSVNRARDDAAAVQVDDGGHGAEHGGPGRTSAAVERGEL